MVPFIEGKDTRSSSSLYNWHLQCNSLLTHTSNKQIKGRGTNKQTNKQIQQTTNKVGLAAFNQTEIQLSLNLTQVSGFPSAAFQYLPTFDYLIVSFTGHSGAWPNMYIGTQFSIFFGNREVFLWYTSVHMHSNRQFIKFTVSLKCGFLLTMASTKLYLRNSLQFVWSYSKSFRRALQGKISALCKIKNYWYMKGCQAMIN